MPGLLLGETKEVIAERHESNTMNVSWPAAASRNTWGEIATEV